MDSLIALHNQYKQKYKINDAWNDLKYLYGSFVREKKQTIVDALASGVALEGIISTGSYDHLSPQMEEAFDLAFPNEDIASLADRTPEEISGFINGWKGKLFEVDVRDRLNNGEWVGDLHLDVDHEQIAELAASATQPGWDLAILGSDGTMVDQIQLKATDSLSYIKHAIEKYPDIHILSTAEVGSDLPDHLDNLVSVSDISNDHITDMVTDSLSDSFGDSLLDVFLPGLPLAIIGITEGYGVVSGKRSADRAMERAVSRTGKGILAGLGGWILSYFFGDVTGVVGGVACRLLLGGEKDAPKVPTTIDIPINYERLNKRLEDAIKVPTMLLPHYS